MPVRAGDRDRRAFRPSRFAKRRETRRWQRSRRSRRSSCYARSHVVSEPPIAGSTDVMLSEGFEVCARWPFPHAVSTFCPPRRRCVETGGNYGVFCELELPSAKQDTATVTSIRSQTPIIRPRRSSPRPRAARTCGASAQGIAVGQKPADRRSLVRRVSGLVRGAVFCRRLPSRDAD
jgi:hypothetical protein